MKLSGNSAQWADYPGELMLSVMFKISSQIGAPSYLRVRGLDGM